MLRYFLPHGCVRIESFTCVGHTVILRETAVSNEVVQTCSSRAEKLLLRLRRLQVLKVGEGTVLTLLPVNVRLELAHAISKDDHFTTLRLVSQVSELTLLVLTKIMPFILLKQLVDDCLTSDLQELPSSQHRVIRSLIVSFEIECSLPISLQVILENSAVFSEVCPAFSFGILFRGRLFCISSRTLTCLA